MFKFLPGNRPHHPHTSPVISPNILLSNLFSDIVNWAPKGEKTNFIPINTAGNISVLYINSTDF